MAYKIQYLDLAKSDVKEIKSYLTQFYPSTPAKFLADLKKNITNLSSMPGMYEAYHDNPSYHRLVVSNYLVFYKVDDKNQTVEIHRILHGARDLSRYLQTE
ncbi:type II toxin-antitoxin system RelE/ParE family toxin [Treponema primitia]|uniref:type II toxin-antitoxin system RelE/ParE family toxin n=1 Tax=Treponema primitia TaxID=88058 RepID=UPI00397ECFEC